MNHFAVLMQFLRDRPQFFADVQQEKYLNQTALSLLVCSSGFFALYGMILGSFSGGIQILVSAIKLPALYLLTLAICLPALFFFEVVAGSKRSFLQYLVLLLGAMGVIGVMLLGFAPVTLFFRLSLSDYVFFQLLNIFILGLASVIGVQVFYRGMVAITAEDGQVQQRRQRAMQMWLILYGFVGSQLGWTLRPFFGNPNQDFELFRDLESNFFLHVLRLLGQLFHY
ncbi:MAG: actin-binding WH2 domain-containing protein [Spirulina sp. SIO3F2]|nr:actin-binding WH2 domain-containing protein [Spirulina sp. SIO3F2]